MKQPKNSNEFKKEILRLSKKVAKEAKEDQERFEIFLETQKEIDRRFKVLVETLTHNQTLN